jgi:hypothetical protein
MSDAVVQSRLAKVVHVIDPDMAYAPIEVVINRGLADGVKTGDRFLVFGDGPMINDPDTGKELGQLEVVRGRGEVVHVQEHLATIRSIERRRERPAKRVFHEAPRGVMAGLINNPYPRTGPVVEEEFAPEVTIPFQHVRLGDQAKSI